MTEKERISAIIADSIKNGNYNVISMDAFAKRSFGKTVAMAVIRFFRSIWFFMKKLVQKLCRKFFA